MKKQVLGSPDQEAAPPGAEDPTDQSPKQEDQTFTRAQLDEALEAQKVELEVQINDVRSSLSKAQNIERGAWGEERARWEERDKTLQQQLHESNVKDMDDDARAKYERNFYEQKSADLEERLAATDQQLVAALSMGQYAQSLQTAFGVEPGKLDMSDPTRLSETAWEEATSKHQEILGELEARTKELEDLRAGKTVDTLEPKPLRKAPDVVTDSGGTIRGAPTLLDLRKNITQQRGLSDLISEEQLFEMAENPEDTGVDLNVVLRSIQAEIDATS